MPGVGPKPRGADLVATALADAGVRKVFALSGNHVMALFDALFGSRIEIVHVRHEAAAVHMAALGALYTALAADSPLVLLSGHAALAQLGRGAFQEMAQVDVARPLTKASWHATSAQSLGREITRALSIATAGRPGPVHLSLPV
ncbi:MAG: thiamine pyrophosphate-binding protein, partial [Burkholderiaceae bacterium]|nr:thiamine pyrophosphate-binding protein [Burkholderiaceae bacterium]